ncbi:hypothetical protein RJO23_001180 [Enterobacter hormaechei]|nr:hypothetical protein [Enterobacter hormaechei]
MSLLKDIQIFIAANQQLKGSGIELRHHTDSIKLVGHPFKPVFPLLVEMLRRWGYP